MECPECQTENPEINKFCRECGAKLSLLCPECGAMVLREGSRIINFYKKEEKGIG
jgi:predicted amidophosphoribosyltransferase